MPDIIICNSFEKQKRQVSELMFFVTYPFIWSWKPHFTVSYSSTIFCPRFELNPLFFCNQWRPCKPLQRTPPSLCRIIDYVCNLELSDILLKFHNCEVSQTVFKATPQTFNVLAVLMATQRTFLELNLS